MLSLSPFSAPKEEDGGTLKKQGSHSGRSVLCSRSSRFFQRRRSKTRKDGVSEASGVVIEDLPSTIQAMSPGVGLNEGLSTSFTMIGEENGHELGFSSDIVALPRKPAPRIDTPLHRPKNATVWMRVDLYNMYACAYLLAGHMFAAWAL